MAQDRRSDSEAGLAFADWWRRLCKAQRGRIATKFAASDRRVAKARTDAMEDWDGLNRRGSKKPSLDYYDARWR